MNPSRFALSGLLAASPLLGLAQATSPAPTPRYYVGLALYASDYQPLGGSYYRGVTVPVQLTVGYQLRPRLAVQASVAYSSANANYFGLGKYYSGSAAAASPYAFFEYHGSTSSRTISTTLLARYALTRQAAHRLQVDVLGGFVQVYQRSTRTQVQTDTDSTQTVLVTRSTGSEVEQYDLLLAAGASARYRLGRHLEAVFDVMLNHNLKASPITGYPSATALGLRYRFGGLR